MSDTVFARLSALLIARFGVTAEELTPDVTYAELDLDSLALVEFIVVAEEEFGVPISEDELSPEDTVTDTVELLGAKGVTV